jgi:hypothetical protein
MTKALEILDRQLRESFALAQRQVIRHRVRITKGIHKNKPALATSAIVGTKGQLLINVELDDRTGMQGRKWRLCLPLDFMVIGDYVPLTTRERDTRPRRQLSWSIPNIFKRPPEPSHDDRRAV